MKSYRKVLTFNTKTRRAYINITPQVEAALSESGFREGLCLVNAMNITASAPPQTQGDGTILSTFIKSDKTYRPHLSEVVSEVVLDDLFE